MMIDQIAPMRRVAIYCRVSTAEQATDGYSLASQEDRTRDYCNAKEFTVVEVIRDEGQSGKSVNRPGMQRLLALVESGEVDVVAIHKLDRLTRTVEDFWRLLRRFEDSGVALVSVQDDLNTSNASGRLVVSIMMSVSQWEREVIAERTKEALAVAKTRGVHLGKPPVGWKVEGGKLVPGDRIGVVVQVHALRREGLTLQQIADRMNELGIPSARGGVWRKNTVVRALSAPLPDDEPIAPLYEPSPPRLTSPQNPRGCPLSDVRALRG